MKLIERKIIDVNPKDFIKRAAASKDCQEIIDSSTKILSPSGELLVVYETDVDEPALKLARQELQLTRFTWNTRSGGLKTLSEIFGYAPRNALRKQPCRSALLSAEQPVTAETLKAAGEFLNEWYKTNSPDAYATHKDTVTKVLNEWRMKDSVFTSGIANKNNVIDYHFDKGNFKRCHSVMIGFKKNCTGGFLSVPQLGIKFDISDNSIISFDGQSLIHGVTPISISPGGFRYTVVYYSLSQMWKCVPIDEELIEFRKKMDVQAENMRRNGKYA